MTKPFRLCNVSVGCVLERDHSDPCDPYVGGRSRATTPDIVDFSTWRVGRKVGRTIYAGDTLIGVMDRTEDAKAIVDMIAALRAAEARVEVLETVLSLAQAHGETPIPMVLHCPICSLLHVDENGWELRQHRTHQCQGCGYEWRPCSRPTVGVAAIASPGQGEEKT